MPKLPNTLIILPYDPNWKTEFERIRDYLMEQIGDLLLEIKHVGSTSVPGLCAKPIIDIVAVMESYEVFPQIVSRLENVGFRHEGDLGIKEREVFKRLIPDDFMDYHFYVYPKDSEENRRHTIFRNALLADKSIADEYGRLKMRLIEEVNGDRVLYTNSKSDFILGAIEKSIMNDTKQQIIAKLKERLEGLNYVYALWLEGADANGTSDEYSDIDIWADIADENEAEAIEATEDALREIAEIDYRYVMNHSHPQIRQRIYHLQGTSEYLMIDFCWQLHSRPRNSYSYYENDQIEAVKVIFDKDSIIRYRPYDQSAFTTSNAALLEEMKYRYTQHSRVIKYVRRGLYPEAFAYYQRYVLEPLVCLLRILYTPAYTDYGFVHISQHIPKVSADRLTYFSQVSSFEDIEQKTAEAKGWLGELVEGVKL